MRTEFLFAEIFAHPKDFYGKHVGVKAVLVVKGGECYLVQNFKSYAPAQRIEVFSPRLEEKLDKMVGAWVGEPASYFEKVVISGVLQEGTTRKCLFSICDLTALEVVREGNAYTVI